MKERVLFYSSKMITEQVGSDDRFQEIKRVISIIITDFMLIAESEKYHHRFTLYDYENNEDLEMIAEKSPQVKKAVFRLMELSEDEKTRMLYESRQKLEWHIQGREHARGHETARIIAKNMLKRNRPIDEIVEDTGLDCEEIKNLQNADF